jgi:membrane-bound ClpP family serine protease
MDSLASWIFAAFTLAGVGYFLFVILTGDLAEGAGDGEFGAMVAAAFAAGFGAFGLLGTLSKWSLPVTLLTAAVFGYALGKFGLWVLRAVMRQQTLDSIPKMGKLVGLSGRVTIDSAAGKTGEAMLDGSAHVTRSAVKEVNGEALKRGDIVQVVSAESGLLYVKKKNN